MKKFEVYKNIRKGAMIWGLPVSLFALMMISIVGSLLVIIFSFSFFLIVGVLIFNAALYIFLTRVSGKISLNQFSPVFPKIITAKKSSNLNYE